MANWKHFLHKNILGRYEYLKKFKKIGISFNEFYSYKYTGAADNITTFATSKIYGVNIKRVGNYSFVQNVEEVLIDEVYKFRSNISNPYIVDCGANIGLSIIHFKKQYPECKVVAFEPDPNIFKVCQENINAFDFNNVELINAAVWKSNGELNFVSDNSLGGKISDNNKSVSSTTVKAVRLSNYLNEKIDFLKIDIEGAELDVLEDCKEKLNNVNLLFVEYHSSSNQKQELQRILDIMTKAGFRYYFKHAYDYMKHPFVEFPANKNLPFDLQLNIFAYRNNV